MASAKWFKNLSERTSAVHSARVVLESRAQSVTQFLMIVARGETDDPEQVHQLRVATRRLGAALSIFRDMLRPADHRRWRRVTRRIRRAAGAARDLDVHRELLASQIRAAGARGLELAKVCDEGILLRRRLAERQLTRVASVSLREFSAATARGLATLKSADHNSRAMPTLGTLGHRTLKSRLKKLRAARRKDLHNFDKLHQVRIAAKRLRYSMEVFAGCYPPAFRSSYYRIVEQIQEELGRINDLRSLAQTVSQVAAENTPRNQVDPRRPAPLTAQQFRTRLQRQAKLLRNRFLSRWETTIKRKLQRLKVLILRHAGESRIHVARISEL